MREPQATSTLGKCPRTPRVTVGPTTWVAMLLALGVVMPLSAQPRGRSTTSVSRWWFSAGAGAAKQADVSDGPTNAIWHFGNDPLWQMRGTLERAMDATTTLGVSGSYGNVDLGVRPLAFATVQPRPPTNDPVLDACFRSGCDATANLWNMMLQFRTGGGPSFHSVIEAAVGMTGIQSLKTKDSKAPISSGSRDATAMLGFGFGFPLGAGTEITLVQDASINWHNKEGLPSGTGRTWRARTTRLSLRFRL